MDVNFSSRKVVGKEQLKLPILTPRPEPKKLGLNALSPRDSRNPSVTNSSRDSSELNIQISSSRNLQPMLRYESSVVFSKSIELSDKE